MDAQTEPLALADAHLRAGRLAEAVEGYAGILEIEPLNVDVLGSLATVLLALGRLDEAVLRYLQVLRLKPDRMEARRNLGVALHHFGQGLAAQGLLDPAAVEDPGEVDPEDPQVLLQLGHFFQYHGNAGAAILMYERAVALAPACAEAMVRLGTLHAEAGRLGPAARWFTWALALDPTLAEANFNLAAILESDARLVEAQVYRGRLPRPLPLDVEPAHAPRRTVLVPCAAGSGTLPTERLLPRETTTCIKWFPECATDEQEANLPPFDLVFNAIGNADLIGPAWERLRRFHERVPMLNPPEKILRTRRDLMPSLLAGLPGVVVPKVARLRRDEVQEPWLLARLEALGLCLPLLVRPIGSQGGKGARRVETADQLAPALASDADAFYFIAFHDTLGPDGHYRKYRMIFVDRRPYPYHLAISRDWLVHWFSADMLAAPWKREEERRFMEDPGKVLGPASLAAIEAIGNRLDLDYAGVDFALLPDGRILVFEANATMLVHLHDAQEDFPYKHQVVPAILEAFEAMLSAYPHRITPDPQGPGPA